MGALPLLYAAAAPGGPGQRLHRAPTASCRDPGVPDEGALEPALLRHRSAGTALGGLGEAHRRALRAAALRDRGSGVVVGAERPRAARGGAPPRVGWPRACRDLERERPARPARLRAGLAPRARARRGGAPGAQAHRRPLPAPGLRGRRLPGPDPRPEELERGRDPEPRARRGSPRRACRARRSSARVCSARRSAGLSFTTVYCPNGKHLEHPDFPRKLAWFDALAAHLGERHDRRGGPPCSAATSTSVPAPLDSWNGEGLEGSIFHTEEERARFRRLLDWGLVDLFRERFPDLQAFSWWDYRGGAFHRKQGLRIDFLLATASAGGAGARRGDRPGVPEEAGGPHPIRPRTRLGGSGLIRAAPGRARCRLDGHPAGDPQPLLQLGANPR